MKRETCKKLLENGVLQAYAEGKTIVWSGKDIKDDLELSFNDPSDWYSIKKEPKWRPFNQSELKSLIGRSVVKKDKSAGFLITSYIHEEYISLNNNWKWVNAEALFVNYEFADGFPCGVFE